MSRTKETATRRPDAGGRSTVFGTKGAVACEHPSAALAGLRTLDAGGTAADACVAMAAAMVVLSPMQTGMGGDAFLLFYEAETGQVSGVNGAGRAPGAVSVEKLLDLGLTEMPEHGGLTVTVPGAVRLWEDAVNRFGNQPLARLLEPAWELAENGHPVAEVVARYWKEHVSVLSKNEAATRTFLQEGRAPVAGEIFSQVDLAATLSTVAEGGRRYLLQGRDSRVHRALRAAGGRVSHRRRPRGARIDVRRADLDRLQGRSGLRDPTPGPGRRRPGDAQHPRRVRLLFSRTLRARTASTSRSRRRSWPSETCTMRSETPSSGATRRARRERLISKDYASEPARTHLAGTRR